MSVQTLTSNVRLEQNAIYIHDRPVIILCGSLFYFRIPRALWQDRLQKIKDAGYNCIDVYIPWNYHELEEGGWDFSGERDVETFFQLAVETGLWIVARPGPYICSEWDGGALPGYLSTHHGIRLRDNNPIYLRYVSRWFDRILPMLSHFQVKNGTPGGIIALQLENELDFFDCEDPTGYMKALQDLARKHNFTVPLIGCAGQGDLAGATGNVPGIIPTCNFYPNLLDSGLEAKVSHYREELKQRQFPLLVTETHRPHFHLRRLLSCGAKLLGPYNQVGGTNFGFTNAINNWGNPLAFLTSDYDFNSMITATGEVTDEYFEARLLFRLLEALGEFLAQATPISHPDLSIRTALPIAEGGPYGLALHGGGTLTAFPNLTSATGIIVIQDGDLIFPRYSTFTIPSGCCPLLLRNMPLSRWGLEGTLLYATGELGCAVSSPNRVVLAFYTDQTAELAFSLPSGVNIKASGMTVHTDPDRITCCFDSEQVSTVAMTFPNGALLQVVGMDRYHAARVEEFGPDGVPVWKQQYFSQQEPRKLEVGSRPQVSWSSHTIRDHPDVFCSSKITCGTSAKHLEEVGILRGYGWYGARVSVNKTQQIQGFLLHEGADILSLYVNGLYHGTVTPGGGTTYLPALKPVNDSEAELVIRTEIWGHSNFDDARLPAIRLGSLRGLHGVTVVTAQRDFSKNWRFALVLSDEQKQNVFSSEQALSYWIIVDWANWLTTHQPHKGCFCKQFAASEGANSWTLHFPDLRFLAEVFVNGTSMGHINPFTPYLNITSAVHPGQTAEVRIYTEQFYTSPGGTITLLEGISAEEWWVAGSGEAEFVAAAQEARPHAVSTELPFRLPAGEISWLWGEFPDRGGCWTVYFTGRNAKISAFFNEKLVGRVWLSSTDVRPKMVGGADDRLYLPEPWFRQGGNRLTLFVESVKLGEEAELTRIEFQRVKNS